LKYTNGSVHSVTLPRRNSKQFKALNVFAGKRFTFTEIQNWAIRENRMEGRVNHRGYWSVNLTDCKYGLLTRFAKRHCDGSYTIRPEVITALNSVGC
jgi:hypothetical protein